MAGLKELAMQGTELFTGGHRACAGCGFPPTVRMVLLAASDRPVVAGAATGCLEVTSTIFPQTAWRCSFIHNAFENVAATISGVEAAARALRRKGKLEADFHFVAFGGDGGTYDIGLQSLSGAMERGHRMLYLCYDNEGYANTGMQRSGATPRGAATTTSPSGRGSAGKPQRRKDLTAILAAHNLPFVAQSSVAHWSDLTTKVQKALQADGPAFINVLAPCRLIWGIPPEETVDMTRHAVDTCFWPLYQVEDGRWKLTYRPREKKRLADWLKRQARFKHLFTGEHDDLLAELQAEVDRSWEELLVRCGELATKR